MSPGLFLIRRLENQALTHYESIHPVEFIKALNAFTEFLWKQLI